MSGQGQPSRRDARRAELLAKPADRLTGMERGELRALGPAAPEARALAEQKAAALLAKPSLTPGERGQLRAAARELPAYERQRVLAYLDALVDRG